LNVLIVNVDPELSERMHGPPKMALTDRCPGFARVTSRSRWPIQAYGQSRLLNEF
jgi:hypothetical protein